MSPETEAIVNQLKEEGEALRSKGPDSIKEVKVELAKFNGVFNEMSQAFKGISQSSAAAASLAEQEAKLRALSDEERQKYYEVEAENAKRDQETAKRKSIADLKAQKKADRNNNSLIKSMKSIFGGIAGFFKRWGNLLVGGAFAYEFIAGMIEEQFGVEIPTIADGFRKLVDFLGKVEWDKVAAGFATIASLVVLGKILAGVGSAALGILGLKSLLGRGGTPPVVNPGTAGAGGGRNQPPPRTPPRNFTIDDDGNPRSNRTGQLLTGGARETALRTAAGDRAANSWWNRTKNSLLRSKKPGMVGAGITAATVIGLIDEQELEAANTAEADLLAAIEARDTGISDLVTDTVISAGVGAGTGAAVGALGMGVGAGPGALAGAISGAAWGFGTSALLGVKRWFEDSGEGIDELPNSVEDALRAEQDAIGGSVEEQLAALTAVRDAAKKFVDDNTEALNTSIEEVNSLQAILDAEPNATGTYTVNGRSVTKRRLERMIAEAEEDRDLLQRQVDTSSNILQRRNESLEDYNKRVAEAQRQQELIDKQYQDTMTPEMIDLSNMFGMSGGNNGFSYVNNSGAPVVYNIASSSAQNMSSVTSYAVGYGGGDRSGFGIAIPGLVG